MTPSGIELYAIDSDLAIEELPQGNALSSWMCGHSFSCPLACFASA